MVVTREDLNPCTVNLTVTCEPDQVKAGFDKAFKQIAKKLRVPGFRPGHAPQAVLENLVAKDDLYEEAAEQMFRSTYILVIEKEKLQPDGTTKPKVNFTKLDRADLTAEYTVKVALPPSVEIGEYKSIPVEKQSSEVSEEEIDQQIEEFRKGRSRRELVTDRGAVDGDIAVVNIKVDGDTGEGRDFMIVVGQTNSESLDAALLGMKVEEMKSLDLAFSDAFQDKEWAGKSMHAQITLNSLRAVQLPTLDDEFAKSLKTENVADLRVRLRELIGQSKIEMQREFMLGEILKQLQERSKVFVSDNMWEDLATRRLTEQAEELAKQGKSIETYAQENGMTLEELVQAWRDKSKHHVEQALLIREVFTKEEMQLTNQELNQELYAMASEYEQEPEEMLRVLKANDALDELQYRAISRKVGDFLVSSADIKEPVAAGS